MSEVTEARADALIEEFSFLGTIVPRGGLIRCVEHDEFRVSRIDLDLLDRVPFIKARDLFEKWAKILFIIIGTNGQVLRWVSIRRRTRSNVRWWNPRSWFPRKFKGETALEGIRQLDDPNQVAYVLELKIGCGYAITVYKIPRCRTFAEWLDNINTHAKTELQVKLGRI